MIKKEIRETGKRCKNSPIALTTGEIRFERLKIFTLIPMKLILKINLFICLLILFFSTALQAQNASRKDCFSFEKLPPEQRQKAETLLLKALDGESLYTLVGGLKPMSSSFQSFEVDVNLPRLETAEAEKIIAALGAKKAEDLSAEEKSRLSQAKRAIERGQSLTRIAEMKMIFEHWRCGDEIYADMQHYAQTYEGKRHFDTVVFSRPSLRKMIAEKTDFFSRLGIVPESHPLEVLYAVEYNQTSARFGGYGYLFGYPDYAVRFFVQSSDEEKFTGKFVERSFISLPTFAGENRFVYAVPKGYIETETDKTLRKKTENIFNEYKRRRAQYIGEGKKGAVEMLRDWFCVSPESCSPSNVKF